ncbi:MAG: alpha/beta hydrolase [Clostridiales bacterium]|nr:alpha/beta hydrolase [Clostridiales bacterium]
MGKKYRIWEREEYEYARAFGFIPEICGYIHRDNKKRRAVLVVPGGGYTIVSPTEAEIVAKKFFKAGYQAFVLTYTTNFLHDMPLMSQPLQDISRAVRILRQRADEWRIEKNRVVLCGFSAGAHLCASLAVHYEEIEDCRNEYKAYSNRPDAVVLASPVISTGECRHSDSMEALLGKHPSEEMMSYMSVEKHITSCTPPSFVWQMSEDEVVSVQNSILYVQGCIEKGVEVAYRLYTGKGHSLSTADRAWEEGEFGKFYTLKQMNMVLEAGKRGEVRIGEEALKISKMVKEWTKPQNHYVYRDEDVKNWTRDVIKWLQKIL